MSDAEPSSRRRPDPGALQPVTVKFTVNQLVGYNITYFRKVAGLTQEELGERLGGWSAASVSAAERSWDGKRIRKFDADELVMIAVALGIPIPGLFLPPDAGAGVHVVLDAGGPAIADFLSLILPTDEGESPVMDAYRKRVIAAGVKTPADLVEVLEEARKRAGMRDVDAATASLVEQRERLERKLDELRTFERDYRARLHTYLVGQLRALWSGDMRPGVEELVEEASRMAAEGGAQATGVLLRDDGTYESFEFSGGAGEQVEQAEQEDEP